MNFLLYLALSLAPHSNAEEPKPRSIDEVSLQEITFLGEPVQDQKTKEILGLTCVEYTNEVSNCKAMRFVSMKEKSAFYFGDAIRVINPEQLEGETKALYQNLKDNYRTASGGREKLALSIAALGGFGGLTAGVIAGISAVWVIPLFFVYMGGVVAVDELESKVDFFAGTGTVAAYSNFKVTRTTQGWNWHTTAKKMSHRTFYTTKYAILTLGDESINETRPVSMRFREREEAHCTVQYEITGRYNRADSELSATDTLALLNGLHHASDAADANDCRLSAEAGEFKFTQSREGLYRGPRAQQAYGYVESFTFSSSLTPNKPIFKRYKTLRYGMELFTPYLKGDWKRDLKISEMKIQ